MSKKLLLCLISLAAILFLLTGCSQEEFPAGKSIVTEYRDQKLTIYFNADGTFQFVWPDRGGLATDGTYSVEGNKLTFESDSTCEEQGHPGHTYEWKITDDQIAFEPVGDDPCFDRLGTMGKGRVWIIEP
ncbi:MAG: hypothetical protein P8Y68_11110 [Anaerolineales bacterium]|jgi:hypothetical protein